jgi:serine/threonine protein kinase
VLFLMLKISFFVLFQFLLELKLFLISFLNQIHSFTKNSIEGSTGRASDIWSIGCVVLEMLTGLRPWHDLGSNNLSIYCSHIILFTLLT